MPYDDLEEYTTLEALLGMGASLRRKLKLSPRGWLKAGHVVMASGGTLYSTVNTSGERVVADATLRAGPGKQQQNGIQPWVGYAAADGGGTLASTTIKAAPASGYAVRTVQIEAKVSAASAGGQLAITDGTNVITLKTDDKVTYGPLVANLKGADATALTMSGSSLGAATKVTVAAVCVEEAV